MDTTPRSQEKAIERSEGTLGTIDDEAQLSTASNSQHKNRRLERVLRKIWKLGVESRGIQPIPSTDRVDCPYSRIFFVWFSVNFNILSFSAGTLGPIAFGLGLRASCLSILFFNLLCGIPPAYFATWGPKFGMRQMVLSRYTFGYYGVIIPCIFNLIGMIGFSILNSILGGQALASVSNGDLSWTVGIVVTAIISVLVSFCGYNVLNWYERVAWLPVLVAYLTAIGTGHKNLSIPIDTPPATAASVISFGSTLAGFLITYSGLSSDFTSYFKTTASSWGIFFAAYFGFLIPIVSLQCLGAATALVAPMVPGWETAYVGGNVGGLLEAMLSPVGGFGKFLTVLLSLSVAGNIAATFYSISINLQVFLPILGSMPRYIFSIVAAVIVTVLAVVGARRFYDTLVNFLGIIGYWASAYVGILLVEHIYFRKNDVASYDRSIWNNPKRLPTGLVALAAGVAAFGVTIPFMDQVWYVGPIGHRTGDLGFEVAFVASVILYVPFRWMGDRFLSRR